jgi:hypothetical protein
MNNKILTIAALAAVLVAGIFATTPMAAFADESETETKQEIKQKNFGSGESTNVNCGDNDISGVEEEPTFLELQLCGTLDIGEEEPPVIGPPVIGPG